MLCCRLRTIGRDFPQLNSNLVKARLHRRRSSEITTQMIVEEAKDIVLGKCVGLSPNDPMKLDEAMRTIVQALKDQRRLEEFCVRAVKCLDGEDNILELCREIALYMVNRETHA